MPRKVKFYTLYQMRESWQSCNRGSGNIKAVTVIFQSGAGAAAIWASASACAFSRHEVWLHRWARITTNFKRNSSSRV